MAVGKMNSRSLYDVEPVDKLNEELKEVQNKQLEAEADQFRNKLKFTRERMEKLTSQLHLVKQQLEFFLQEARKAQECSKDANWAFTKEACASLLTIKKPSAAVTELGELFLLVLDQQDCSWKGFLSIAKHYTPLKGLMNSFQARALTDEQLKRLTPFWERQQSWQPKLKAFGRGVELLAEWLCSSLECKLRFDALEASKLKAQDLKKKIRHHMDCVSKYNAGLLTVEEHIDEVQLEIRNLHNRETSGTSLTSSFSVLPFQPISYNALQKGTASGGILGQPTFGAFFNDSITSENPSPLECEGASQSFGWCRLRFFCF